MSGNCVEVPPLSRANIRDFANHVRTVFRVSEPYFPIVQFMETFSELDGEFVYDIQSVREMGENHGETFPDRKLMLIREDVYERATEGHGRDRLTIAHEFGHLFLHGGVGLARRVGESAPLPAYKDSEWQANCFGGELLVCSELIKNYKSAGEVAMAFGVSEEAAKVQMRSN